MSKKTLFRRVLESMAEGRMRQAQRFVDDYMKSQRDNGRQG